MFKRVKKERRLKTTTSIWFNLTHITETYDVKFQLCLKVTTIRKSNNIRPRTKLQFFFYSTINHNPFSTIMSSKKPFKFLFPKIKIRSCLNYFIYCLPEELRFQLNRILVSITQLEFSDSLLAHTRIQIYFIYDLRNSPSYHETHF